LAARDGGEVLLCDAGTFTYVGDPQWRDWFRGTSAHNTVVIDAQNQAVTAGAFRWVEKPDAELVSESPLTAVCRYNGFTHKRRLIWKDDTTLVVIDEVSGPGEHEVAQLWHSPTVMAMISPACFQLGSRAKLWANPDTSREYAEGGQRGWQSPAYGVKDVAAVLRVMRRGALPVKLTAVIDFAGKYSEWQPEWSELLPD
jgi:hypothetical protein